ncbi:hypothetical protein FJT64_013800 [Amphibalanus amphitrite]|uniref:Uncharacterized protein n=1 Tax=Amphibalanus amphitrite TaxID=1232801 RepID=A0A6A4V8A7_AMPAM|nr:hypothetical protein FJT64_013800 [Amphibalanus amphitrite]
MPSASCWLWALRPSRVCEILLWVTFLGLATFEWVQYRSEPTLTMVELEPAELPRFTVCPGYQSNGSMTNKPRSTALHHMWFIVNETAYHNTSFRKMYIDYGLSIGDMLGRRIENENTSRDSTGDVVYRTPKGFWLRTFLKSGVCYMYQPHGQQDNKASPFLGPTIRLLEHPEFTQRSTKSSYMMRFHGSEVPFKAIEFFHKDIPRVVIREAENLLITVRLNKYKSPSLRRKPCNKTPGYSLSGCLSQCFYQKQKEKIGCTMPWMDLDGKGCTFYSRDFAIPPTSGYPEDCGCLPACLEDRIDVIVGRSPIVNRKGYTYVTIKFEYEAETRITTLSYSIRDLVANVGGHIGLFLGTSILSLLLRGFAALQELHRQKQSPVISIQSDGK